MNNLKFFRQLEGFHSIRASKVKIHCIDTFLRLFSSRINSPRQFSDNLP